MPWWHTECHQISTTKKMTLQERLKKWFVHPPYGRRKNRNTIDAKDLSLVQPHPIFQNAALAKVFPTEILLKDNETKHTDSRFRLIFFRPRVPLKPNHTQCLSVCPGSLLSLDVLLRGTDVMRDRGVAGESFVFSEPLAKLRGDFCRSYK